MKMKSFEIIIKKETPFGKKIFRVKPEFRKNLTALFTIYDEGQEVETIFCDFIDPELLNKIQGILNEYVKSQRFLDNGKEAGTGY